MEFDTLLRILLWFAAVGCGVMAGVYFAFSTFIMHSLASVPPAEGARAMQAINRVIVRSAFLPLFFATSATCAAIIVFAALGEGEPRQFAAIVGGAIYVVGMFVSTIALNIPLNNELDRVDVESEQGAAVWARYLKVWTSRNHVRTIASTVASVLLITALVGAG